MNWTINLHFDDKGSIISIKSIARDVTEHKKTQTSLAQADRLASLGLLSGGIAHEIRNPLGAIRLFTDILTDEGRYDRSESEQELALGKAIRPIAADTVGISQVIVNLVSNAIDAMPHGGVLCIETFEDE